MTVPVLLEIVAALGVCDCNDMALAGDSRVEPIRDAVGRLVTWLAQPGEAIVVPSGVGHQFVGPGDAPSRVRAVGPAQFEQFFRALATAWAGPYDRDKTPAAVAPVFAGFGMQMCAA